MAEISRFFADDGGDRLYGSADFAEYFAALIGNGVFPSPASGLQIVVGSGMSVRESIGQGWINGYWYKNTLAKDLTVSAADATNPRITRVILQLDLATKAITCILRNGTATASPVAPGYNRTSAQYELVLADIYVPAGATSITDANITDQRANATYCGTVAGLVDQVDMTGLFSQFQAAFSAWFATVQSTMSGNVAANLASQIALIQTAITTRAPARTQDNLANFNIDNPQSNGMWSCYPGMYTGTVPDGEIFFDLYVDAFNLLWYQHEIAYTYAGHLYYRSRNNNGTANSGTWTTWEKITGKTCSTTEHWTGEYWIDGKKIYEKTITATIASGSNNIAHGVPNIGTFRTVVWDRTTLGSANLTMPYMKNSVSTYADFYANSVGIDSIGSAYIVIYRGASNVATTATVTIRYTCTDR
jgi:hypothetical protein